MADTENHDTPQKPAVKIGRLALVASIAVAALLWLWHENEKAGREPSRPTVSEAELERRQAAAIASQRNDAVFELVEKASSAKDPAEKLRIYDEIIETYQDDTGSGMLRCVSWALYKKGQAIKEHSEKARLFEVVIDRYCDVPDKTVTGYVRGTLREALQLIEEGAGKIAFCDRILEKYDKRLPDSLAAWLLSKKAESIRDREEEIAVYDIIISRFLSSDDDSAFDLAIIAAMDKVKLIADEPEQIRLCDIAINAFLSEPQRTRYYLFERAIDKKAQLVGDPSLPLRLVDQVIENNVTESAVVQARSIKFQYLRNDSERMEACDEFIASHQASESDFVQLMVARAMLRKARLLEDREEKAALLGSIIAKCDNIEDSRAKGTASQAVEMLAALNNDKTSVTRHYDGIIAKAESRWDTIRAMENKARLAETPAEKIRLYDEIIAMVGDSNETLESREAISAAFSKIRLINDTMEKIRLYDTIIARGGKSHDHRQRESAAEAMLGKGELLTDQEEKIALYDEIIARAMDGGDKEWLESAARAMIEKAQLVSDREEKIRLYDTVLFELRRLGGRYFVSSALEKRIELTTAQDEKVRLYDRYLDVNGSNIDPDTRASLLLKKAEIITSLAEKSRLYDEIIEFCIQHLKTAESIDGMSFFKSYGKRLILERLGDAVLGRADLYENAEEKLKLYDMYLALPRSNDISLFNTSFEKILSSKADLSGGPSVKNQYFDEKIQTAITDGERFKWYVKKAENAKKTEKTAIEEEMIARFFDTADKMVEGTIARMFLDKIRRTDDAEERNVLCDRLVERYGDSDNDFALSYVVRALGLKAEAAPDTAKRLEIYNAAIEKYVGFDEYFIKNAVNELIAAKFRLESQKE